MYHETTGLQKIDQRALAYLERASELGNSSASFMLGCLYQKGDCVQQDYQKARAYYERNKEDNLSLNYLGNLYYGGKGIAKDRCKAAYYYRYSFLIKKNTEVAET